MNRQPTQHQIISLNFMRHLARRAEEMLSEATQRIWVAELEPHISSRDGVTHTFFLHHWMEPHECLGDTSIISIEVDVDLVKGTICAVEPLSDGSWVRTGNWCSVAHIAWVNQLLQIREQ